MLTAAPVQTADKFGNPAARGNARIGFVRGIAAAIPHQAAPDQRLRQRTSGNRVSKPRCDIWRT
jgi:hypothetical protein